MAWNLHASRMGQWRVIAAAASLSVMVTAGPPVAAADDPKTSLAASRLLPHIIEFDRRVASALEAPDANDLRMLFAEIEVAFAPVFQLHPIEARSCYVALRHMMEFVSSAFRKLEPDPNDVPDTGVGDEIDYKLYAMSVDRCAKAAGHAPIQLKLQSPHVKAL